MFAAVVVIYIYPAIAEIELIKVVKNSITGGSVIVSVAGNGTGVPISGIKLATGPSNMMERIQGI